MLEYMGGGDLLNLLIERDVFEENFARFYAAEVHIGFAFGQTHSEKKRICCTDDSRD